MKNLNFYIAYLLTKHECVIIPNLGAFVVFSVPASKKEIEGVFCPPVQSLGFNPEIKHNDGLLVHFVSEMEGISYKEAERFIKQYVNRFSEQLSIDKSIIVKWIGNFSISPDSKVIFVPNTYLSCNAAGFGFSNFYLPQLKELEQLKEIPGKEEKDRATVTISFNKRILIRAASIAAAVLALSLTPVSLNNNSEQYVTNASFFPVYRIVGSEKKIEIKEEPVSEDVLPTSGEVKIPLTGQREMQVNTRTYHIVIASLPTKNRAERSLANFKQVEFPEAEIISREGRHRIYVKSFEEKSEAESYLTTFRRNNPKYSDAWLFSQNN